MGLHTFDKEVEPQFSVFLYDELFEAQTIKKKSNQVYFGVTSSAHEDCARLCGRRKILHQRQKRHFSYSFNIFNMLIS